MGCLTHIQDMSKIGLDWKVCGKLLEDSVDIAKKCISQDSGVKF